MQIPSPQHHAAEQERGAGSEGGSESTSALPPLLFFYQRASQENITNLEFPPTYKDSTGFEITLKHRVRAIKTQKYPLKCSFS